LTHKRALEYAYLFLERSIPGTDSSVIYKSIKIACFTIELK